MVDSKESGMRCLVVVLANECTGIFSFSHSVRRRHTLVVVFVCAVRAGALSAISSIVAARRRLLC